MSSRKREARIQEFLNQVKQQRLDFSADRYDWFNSTSQYDRYWHTFLSLRRYLAICSSVMAIWSIRSSNHRIMRWAQRVLSLWSTWRMIKSAISPR